MSDYRYCYWLLFALLSESVIFCRRRRAQTAPGSQLTCVSHGTFPLETQAPGRSAARIPQSQSESEAIKEARPMQRQP